MALTQDRDTLTKDGVLFVAPVAAAKKIYQGALVCLDAAGNATPGATATTLKAVGRAEEQVDNIGGNAGDKTIQYRKGIYRFANSAAGDQITRAEIEANCYVVD